MRDEDHLKRGGWGTGCEQIQRHLRALCVADLGRTSRALFTPGASRVAFRDVTGRGVTELTQCPLVCPWTFRIEGGIQREPGLALPALQCFVGILRTAAAADPSASELITNRELGLWRVVAVSPDLPSIRQIPVVIEVPQRTGRWCTKPSSLQSTQPATHSHPEVPLPADVWMKLTEQVRDWNNSLWRGTGRAVHEKTSRGGERLEDRGYLHHTGAIYLQHTTRGVSEVRPTQRSPGWTTRR